MLEDDEELVIEDICDDCNIFAELEMCVCGSCVCEECGKLHALDHGIIVLD